MTKREINTAIRLLSQYTERTETSVSDLGGQCLTAHWVGGGQRIFWAIDEVLEWRESHRVSAGIRD